MAKLQRKSAKLFAEDATAAAGGLAQFGSLAAGTPNYSTDPDVIQALDAYKEGWSSAVLGTKSPALEDRNALDYLLSYQQAYIMQRGIPEYLDTETYYQGSFVSLSDGRLYVSKTDNNTGNNPATDTSETYWMKFPTPQELADGLALKVNKSGDTMTGNLMMSGATVYNSVSGTNYRVLDTRDERKTDWSAMVAISTNDFTAPSDGFIYGYSFGSDYSGYVISVNGVVIGQVGQGQFNQGSMFSVFVSQGDEITVNVYQSGNWARYFVPYIK